MNPICKIWSHKYNVDEHSSPYGTFECKRCGFTLDYNDELQDERTLNVAGRLWHINLKLKRWFNYKTRYFQKCHDCGKRWGNHTSDCAPF